MARMAPSGLTTNHQIPQITESLSINPLSTAHTPGRERERLIAVARAANGDVHDPRDVGIAGGGSRRPVGGRTHIAEGVAAGERRVGLRRVSEARQLLERGEPPPEATAHVLVVAMGLRIEPVEADRLGRLLPDEPRLLIQDGGVGEALQDPKPTWAVDLRIPTLGRPSPLSRAPVSVGPP